MTRHSVVNPNCGFVRAFFASVTKIFGFPPRKAMSRKLPDSYAPLCNRPASRRPVLRPASFRLTGIAVSDHSDASL